MILKMADSESEKRSLLEEKSLVAQKQKSDTSKIWKCFGFKASNSEKKFAFYPLCNAKLKYCRNYQSFYAFLRPASIDLCKV